MPTRNGLFHLTHTLGRRYLFHLILGMEKDEQNDTSTTSSRALGAVKYNDEENQMIFWILKELDLFLENEEALLRKEASTLDDHDDGIDDKKHRVVEVTQKVVENGANLERNNNNSKSDVTVVTGRSLVISRDDGDARNDDEKEDDEEKHSRGGIMNADVRRASELVITEGRTTATANGCHGILTPEEGASVEEGDQKVDTIENEDKTGIKEGEEESSDENDDSQTYSSFGMPIGDACAECFHTEIKSALTNAVHNSHVVCLQAILEQLSQTRDAAEKKKRRRNKRKNANSRCRTKLENGHVACTSVQCDTGGGNDGDESSEPDLASSTLLLQAVTIGHAQVVHLILKCLEDLKQLHGALLVCDSKGSKPIHVAAYENHTSCLDLLLNKTPVKRQFWRDENGRSPLLSAAAGGGVQCLKRLMTVDDLSATGNGGATAVCLAAEAGSVGCLELLIDQALLDPTITDDAGMTPLHFAAEGGHLNCTHWLVRRASCSLNVQRKKDGATAMHLAAAKGRCPILQWALNRGLSCADELDYFGRTPVHYAAEEGHITALKTFAKFVKADLGAKDFLGRSPSHLAERRGHLGCVRYLESSSRHKRSDGEADRPGKISRSLSSSNVNKLVRRGSGRRSAKRRGISSVYLSEGLPGGGGASNGISESFSVDAYLSGQRKTGSIIPKMVTQIGLMSLATILPDADFLKHMTRSESGNVTATNNQT